MRLETCHGKPGYRDIGPHESIVFIQDENNLTPCPMCLLLRRLSALEKRLIDSEKKKGGK